MKKKTSLLLLLFLVISPLIFSGCFKERVTVPYKMTLEVWGVFDDSDAFAEINNEYAKANPQIQMVKYRKISSKSEDYEKELLDALAAGKGPDILFFKNTWLPKHKEKIAALPDSANSLASFQQIFVDVAANDFIEGNSIYAMPLFIDSLALFYNKDLFDQAGLATVPTTWSEVEKLVPQLTKVDQFGNINQSAIALGRSKDPGGINRASDVLMLLMMQKGSQMSDPGTGVAKFNQSVGGRLFSNPGSAAFRFFTNFSQGGSATYSWNSKMDYSVDSFRFGKLAMMLNYSYMYSTLKRLDPKLDIGVAPVPQDNLNNKLTYANYWGLAVSQSKTLTDDSGNQVSYSNQDRVNEAWKYVQFVTADGDTGEDLGIPNEFYLNQTGKPAARRDLVEKQKNEPVRGIFATQSLTAKSWRQKDDSAIDTIFFDMIDDVAAGRATIDRALSTAESRINVLN